MTTVTPEIDALDSAPTGPVTLDSGLQVEVNRLKTRELLALTRILTRGAADHLADVLFDQDQDQEMVVGRLLAAVVIAIPEAEDETVAFVQRMVRPVGVIENARSRPEREVNEGLFDKLAQAMANPELDDTLAIIERVIRVEAPHIQSLGKKLAFLLRTTTRNMSASTETSSESI